jgi:hypothetical protein
MSAAVATLSKSPIGGYCDGISRWLGCGAAVSRVT